MTVNTLAATQITINGKGMKELKNLIKKHKKNSYLNALNHVKIEVINSEQIKVTRIDEKNNLTIVKTIDTLYNETGAVKTFLLPIEQIKKVKGIKKDSVYSIKLLDKNKIEFNNNGIKSTFIIPEHNEFPNEPKINNIVEHGQLTNNDYEHLKQASIYTIQSNLRPVLENVLIRKGEIIATDSHRLYKAKTQKMDNENDVLLHRTLVEMILDNEDKKVFNAFVKTSDNITIIETEKTKYYYVDNNGAAYPQIDKLIPFDFNQVFIIKNTKQFKETIKEAVRITKNVLNNKITLKIVNKNQIEIVASNDIESMNIMFDIKSEGVDDGFEIHFNSKYLYDAIKSFNDTDEIKFNIVEKLRPFVVNKVGDEQTISLILPIRPI